MPFFLFGQNFALTTKTKMKMGNVNGKRLTSDEEELLALAASDRTKEAKALLQKGVNPNVQYKVW